MMWRLVELEYKAVVIGRDNHKGRLLLQLQILTSNNTTAIDQISQPSTPLLILPRSTPKSLRWLSVVLR